nr:unnamed protein product [Leishmania braziliensis]
MAATTSALLLTEEQRELLDQFEFHVIQERKDTPAVWVSSAMCNGAASSHNSSISTTASSLSASRCSSTPSSHLPSAALLNAATDGHEQAEGASRCGLAALHDGGHATALAGAEGDLLQRMRPGESASVMDSDARDLEMQTPPSLHVIAAAPLLHGHSSIRKSVLGASAAGVSVSSHQPSSDLHTNSGSDSTVPLEVLLRSGDADTLDGATQTSVDQQCRELAERLLRSSAEVDAVTFAMDRHVVPPFEFC